MSAAAAANGGARLEGEALIDLGQRVLANGYPPVPVLGPDWPREIVVNGKPQRQSPGKQPHGKLWHDKEHAVYGATPTTVAGWARLRDFTACTNLGIACGRVVCVDIDAYLVELADRLETLARTMLGDTPMRRVGLPPKCALVYRVVGAPLAKALTPQLFKGDTKAQVEVLGHGQQFVAYGIHPDTGRPYSWGEATPATVALDSLPVVTGEQVAAFVAAAEAMMRGAGYAPKVVEAAPRPATAAAAPRPERKVDGNSDFRTVNDVALQQPERWVPDLFPGAVRDGRGGWRVSPAALGRDCEEDLSITPNGIKDWGVHDMGDPRQGKRTAVDLVIEHGVAADHWQAARWLAVRLGLEHLFSEPLGGAEHARELADGLLRGMGAKVLEFPASARASTVAARPYVPVDTGIRGLPVPEEILHPGGLLEDIVAWMMRTARSPHPLLFLASSLCALGAAAGRRYAGPTDLRTNIYCIAVADSGAGKEHAIAAASNLLRTAGLADYLGGEPASGSGLWSSLAHKAVRLFQIDEYGHYLATIGDGRNVMPHKREVLKRFTELTGQASRFVTGPEYANIKERPRVDIEQPCAVLYGTSVPDRLWKALNSGAMADGSVPRMLFFQTPNNFPDRQRPSEHACEPPTDLVERIRLVAAGIPGDGNLGIMASLAMTLDRTVKPDLIRASYADAPAEGLAEALDEQQVKLQRKHEGAPALTAVWARWGEHIQRLALLHAISMDHERPAITVAGLTWARDVANHCVKTLLRAVDQHVADNEHEAMVKRVLGIIRAHGGKMDGTTLAKKTQALKLKDRNEILEQLRLSGQVDWEPVPSTGGRPGMRYWALA